MHTYTHTYIHTYMHTYIHTYIQVVGMPQWTERITTIKPFLTSPTEFFVSGMRFPKPICRCVLLCAYIYVWLDEYFLIFLKVFFASGMTFPKSICGCVYLCVCIYVWVDECVSFTNVQVCVFVHVY